eukprot:scaffold106_cov246-Pinguiococcus_pyrenoidosus.AAC.5
MTECARFNALFPPCFARSIPSLGCTNTLHIRRGLSWRRSRSPTTSLLLEPLRGERADLGTAHLLIVPHPGERGHRGVGGIHQQSRVRVDVVSGRKDGRRDELANVEQPAVPTQ